MLYERFPREILLEKLVKQMDFKPFPTASQRDSWVSLPDEVRQEYIQKGETYLRYPWPPITATLYMGLTLNSDPEPYSKLYFDKRLALLSLALAECMEGQGRFTCQIANGIWNICEETFWGTSAHHYMFRDNTNGLPDVSEQVLDLFAPETGALLVWIYYLLQPELDAISLQITKRLKWEVNRRILEPFYEREDFWWMGYDKNIRINNWNPWVNTNCLAILLILEADEEKKSKGITKALWMLDRFIETYHDDGGCDEGTSYWAAGLLFNCLELLYLSTGGWINIYHESKIRNMGRFLYYAHIDEDYYIDFADGSARLRIAANLVYRYGCRIEDPMLQALGAYAHQFQKTDRSKAIIYKQRATSILDLLFDIFNQQALEVAVSTPPYKRDSWLPGIQVMSAREREGEKTGLYLAAKGGNNGESHNHNDVGNLLIYLDGHPILVDAGVGDYTQKTFSSQRYEIWTMQSDYHNLPTVNGIQQHAGMQYKASEVCYNVTEEAAWISMDIRSAYPQEAGIVNWTRKCLMNRGEAPGIEILDSFNLRCPGDIKHNFMTPCDCIIQSGALVLKGKNGSDVLMEMDRHIFEILVEKVEILDERMSPIWGKSLNKIVLHAKMPQKSAQWSFKFKRKSKDCSDA